LPFAIRNPQSAACLLTLAIIFASCTPATPTPGPTPTESGVPTPTGSTSPIPTERPTPRILAVQPNSAEVARYEKLELTIALEAAYESPYDVRQVDLSATFSGPDGREWLVPGFWDGEAAWRVRFTPSATGEWRYRLQVRDQNGTSAPWEGQFACTPSDHHGWLQVGSWVDPAYSPRYLVHHDGSPFYGVGHCDVVSMMSYGWDAEQGFTLFNRMAEHGENMLVYWPLYSSPFFVMRYDQYSRPDLKTIDLVVEDAERKSIYLVFTIWNHGLLRDATHPWARNTPGLWETQNGFRALGSIDAFFSDDEMWAWQENLYRYFIARWGYSPAIGLWQTVSEIEGTNAGRYLNTWHERVNRYFVEHDPYRHPTTASKAGDAPWPAGYAAMDVAQMHSYASGNSVTRTGLLVARWTREMWQAETKPNFIGEFGTNDERLQPRLLHNGIWTALANGAAITPMDWNDGSTWGSMTDDMMEQMAHLATFVSDAAPGSAQALPLAHLNPSPLQVTTGNRDLRAWGLLSEDKGTAFFWVQDIRPGETRTDVTVTVEGLAPGDYVIRPFDTWQGVYLDESRATADDAGQLTIALPPFDRDIAVRLEQAL
jgi:hypothetical protein